MPLIRYELGCEYSIANPELYKRVPKTDAQALLESITMSALAGIVRQLGELSEFAAEVLGGLNEEVLLLFARGRKLCNRVALLETQLPLAEKFLFSEADQLRFTFAPGLQWSSSLSIEQNHFARGELPPFIKKSFDKCSSPPRFYLLDNFDVDGVGASLKRYTDPSFFRREWAKSELRKAEKSRKARSKAKKEKRSNETKHESPSTPSSSLKTSKFIRSVDSFKEPCAEPVSRPDYSPVRTLKISAAEIEATLLGKSRTSSRDPLTCPGSPDNFVDALATIELEGDNKESAKESSDAPKVEVKQKPDAPHTTPYTSKEGPGPATPCRPTAASPDSPATISETSDESGLSMIHNSHGMLNGSRSRRIYSSTSSSFSSPEYAQPSPSSSSHFSDESLPQHHVFSALDSPMSPGRLSNARSLQSSIASSMRKLLPGSPTSSLFCGTEDLDDHMPPPPPLPPLRWRLSKSPANSKSKSKSTFPVPAPPPAPPPPPPASPPVLIANSGGIVSEHRDLLLDSIASHSLDKLRKVGTHARAKSLDSRDELLEQIRTRSFHLKRADAQERSPQPRSVTSSDVNVAAILEKASAIRQALEGSDEDEDWS